MQLLLSRMFELSDVEVIHVSPLERQHNYRAKKPVSGSVVKLECSMHNVNNDGGKGVPIKLLDGLNC